MNPCDDGLELYRRMLLIRVFEERVLESFSRVSSIAGWLITGGTAEGHFISMLDCKQERRSASALPRAPCGADIRKRRLSFG